jgi:peroxiredoxin
MNAKQLINAAFWVVLVMLGVANVLLVRQNLELRGRLEATRPSELHAGEKVQPFEAAGLGGKSVSVTYPKSGPKKILFYFSPKCPFCREQFAYWRRIVEHVDVNRFEVLGVVDQAEDQDKLADYLKTMGCPADSPTALRVALAAKEVRAAYKLTATPVTLVVANDGTVENAWTGRWTNAEAADAGATLDVDFETR